MESTRSEEEIQINCGNVDDDDDDDDGRAKKPEKQEMLRLENRSVLLDSKDSVSC